MAAHLRGVPERGEITTTAAVGHVRTRGRDAIGRRFDDLHHVAPLRTVTHLDRDLDQFPGKRAVDEHDPPVAPTRQRGTAGDQSLGAHHHGCCVAGPVGHPRSV